MTRKVYLEDEIVALSEYMSASDDAACYHCWQDNETQKGYNFQLTKSFEEFKSGGVRSRFLATIIRKSDGTCVGAIFLSPENSLPDLAIMIYPPYRRNGYATRAFSLGVAYCFDTLKMERIYAGCYPQNAASLRMLNKCGFKPHPQGNQNEQHFLTGEDIVQLDFVIHNPESANNAKNQNPRLGDFYEPG